MRLPATLVSALLLAAMAAGCGGSSKQATPTTGAALATSIATLKPAPVPSAVTGTPPARGAQTEVTGIVGNVNTRANTILIERRSGAPVTTISVVPATVIEQAGGRRITLAQIRPSDRIIATGALDDRGETLIATRITVSQVVPGSGSEG